MTSSASASPQRIALVTGSTDGLGRAVARALADSGFLVLIHGRDAQRGADLVREISGRGGCVRFHRADLASLAQVRALADTVRSEHERLHLLINNAGMGTGEGGRPAPRQTSADGYELRFAVNYLAGYLLTRLLLPLLVRAAPARIVNVASVGQYPLDFDNLMLTRAYSGMRAYAQSKLAQVMLTVDLAAELSDSGVTVNCLHPATYMDTTMVRSAGVAPTSTVAEGAEAVMRLAVSREVEGTTGAYFDGLRPARANAQAYDAAARRRLADLSARLTGSDQPASTTS
ncbi:MAG TPA: SDR family NAD(P)-dependent oxidoreductase [Steroidobacteraceae bacterium]|nr:SDR family NAD(P)-dependent oxidoreductase [Steroidobacteraceae bacterium]